MLQLELRGDREETLRSVFVNTGPEPIALAFWWTRTLRVVDAQGKVVTPGPGPVLPCGVAEDWHLLGPGERFEREEGLACTQPAGRTESIGWSYELAPGTYRVTLIHESPAPHGFSQSRPHPHAFRGRVESNAVALTIAPKPPKRGLLSRLFGGG